MTIHGERFMACREEILKTLSLRNLSPQGHSENPVGQEGCARFRAMLVELLGIDQLAVKRLPKLGVLKKR